MDAREVTDQLVALGNPEIAAHSQRFFKTGEGQYGEGDRFLGIRVPVIRQAVKQHKSQPLEVSLTLLSSEYHEVRLFALLLMVSQFAKADKALQRTIYQRYLNNTRYINNWDLVDSSAHPIVGGYLLTRDRSPLYRLAKSEWLWDRRIAVIATYHFIKQDQFEDTLTLAERLLQDSEDLIHKAVGWMLREVGKRDKGAEVAFLERHCKTMPRTMLRYAIEKFDKTERQLYMYRD